MSSSSLSDLPSRGILGSIVAWNRRSQVAAVRAAGDAPPEQTFHAEDATEALVQILKRQQVSGRSKAIQQPAKRPLEQGVATDPSSIKRPHGFIGSGSAADGRAFQSITGTAQQQHGLAGSAAQGLGPSARTTATGGGQENHMAGSVARGIALVQISQEEIKGKTIKELQDLLKVCCDRSQVVHMRLTCILCSISGTQSPSLGQEGNARAEGD